MAKAWGGGFRKGVLRGYAIQLVWKNSGNSGMPQKTQVPLGSSVTDRVAGPAGSKTDLPGGHGENVVLGLPQGTCHSALAGSLRGQEGSWFSQTQRPVF